MSNQLSEEELTFGDESPVPVIMPGLTPRDHMARRCKPWLLSSAGLQQPNMFNECGKVIK